MLKNYSDLVDKGHDHDHDHAGHDHSHGDHNHAEFNLGWAIIGGILVLNSLLGEWFFYPTPEGGEPAIATTLSAIIGALILAFPIWITAIKDVLKGKLYMNELVALGVLAAFASSAYIEAGIIAFFMLIAILVEEKTAIGAKDAIEDLIRLTPSTARRVGANGEEEEVPALRLSIGDRVRVRPGENFPADGKLVNGTSAVNQAPITGESLPVDKAVGDPIYAGTENLTGAVEVEVTGVGKDTTLGKVRDLIVEAEQTRLPIMRMVDRYVKYYTPTILMIAAVVWFFTQDMATVTLVLIIACPCALVLATPSAVIASIAAAARVGMLIKNVAHIEVAAQLRAIIFDKTGTLTEGNLEVARLSPCDGVELTDLLQVACSAESLSNHPAAKAMHRLAAEANVVWDEPKKYEEVPGRGVIATFEEGVFRVGRESWLRELGLEPAGLSDEDKANEEFIGMSLVWIARDNTVLGWIGLRDAVRQEAAETIAELKALGIKDVAMVTGDNKNVATVVARKIGIREISADCLPEQKVAFVEHLKARGLSVAVVGDGVNDAPALAAGDIGIAMGAIGSDVAVNSASIALMNNDLRRIPFLIKLSRKARTVIHQNLMFGAFLIVGGMMLFIFGDGFISGLARSLSGATKLKIDAFLVKAMIASAIHIGGTLVVLFNSARLVRFGENIDRGRDVLEKKAARPTPPPTTIVEAEPAHA